jgi:HKD family nuclease
MPIELLGPNHRDAIIDAFEKAQQRVRIISPFIQESVSRHLAEATCKGISSSLITRFYREDFIKSVSSLTALKNLCEVGVEIYALKELHAKLYLFDDNVAIIGSANFTGGGFGNNIELSLYIEDEYELIQKLSEYYEQLLASIKAAGDWRVYVDKIEHEIYLVQKSIKGRHESSQPNPERFGANIKTPPAPETSTPDEVEDILAVADESLSAVLKFEGAAHRRRDPNTKYEPNFFVHKGIYFTASSKSPRSLTPKTALFMAVVSWDKSGAGIPIIVGRAKTRGYDPNNTTDSVLINEHSWAVDYPYYVELYDIEIVDTEIKNCISMNDLIAEVGYRLYPSTENARATPIPALKTRHHQKAYIAITPYAASRINTMLEGLFAKYGKSTF